VATEVEAAEDDGDDGVGEGDVLVVVAVGEELVAVPFGFTFVILPLSIVGPFPDHSRRLLGRAEYYSGC